MNSVPFALDLHARRAAAALLATFLALPGCGDDGGETDTEQMMTGGTTTGNNNTTDQTTGDTSTDPTTTMGTTTGQMGELSHATDIQPIWDAYCVTACHTAGGSGAAYFLLTPAEAYDAIVDKPSVMFPNLTYVTPGSRDDSYLWHKVNGTQLEAGGGGSKMPLGMALPAEDLEAIGAWIDQGAKP